jgi:hypothetical protein
LSGIQNELGPKGFQAIEAAINENPNVPGFIEQFRPTFPVGVADHMTAMGYMQFSVAVKPPFVPYMVIIDRTGTIRAQYTGNDPILVNETSMDKNIRAEVMTYLNEVPKTSARSSATHAAHKKK